jgi:hypothetical protein
LSYQADIDLEEAFLNKLQTNRERFVGQQKPDSETSKS